MARDQLVCEGIEFVEIAFSPIVIDQNIVSFDKSLLTKSFPEGL